MVQTYADAEGLDLEVAYDFEDWADYREYNLSFYHLTEIANPINMPEAIKFIAFFLNESFIKP